MTWRAWCVASRKALLCYAHWDIVLPHESSGILISRQAWSRLSSKFMGTQLAEITMAKHCVAAKAEMRCLQSEFDALIAKSGISTPAIDALHRYLYLEENIYE
jgi:2-dehydropantoate 2-reductase